MCFHGWAIFLFYGGRRFRFGARRGQDVLRNLHKESALESYRLTSGCREIGSESPGARPAGEGERAVVVGTIAQDGAILETHRIAGEFALGGEFVTTALDQELNFVARADLSFAS